MQSYATREANQMYKIERAFGRTKIHMPGMTMVSDDITRPKYRELCRQAEIIRQDMELFQQLLTRALAHARNRKK